MNKFQVIGNPIPAAGLKMVVGATSVNASPASDHVVRIIATVDCFVAIGPDTPVAVADTSMFVPANTPEYFYLPFRQKIAVIQAAAGGFLYVTPMALAL